jgi:hypothetical protein
MTGPGVPLSDDLAEYYHSAEPGMVEIETIEIRHPAFVDAEGHPITALRFANDSVGFQARLESDAPVDAGMLVTFSPGRFDLVPPDSPEQGNPKATIAIDNVLQLLSPYMDAAVSQNAPIQVSFRSYLSDDFTQPAAVLHGLTLGSTQSGTTRITGNLSFDDVLNAPFHDMIYRTDKWIALVR